MKVHPIPHAIFETTRSGFVQILHHCSVSWKITPPFILRQTSYAWGKNGPLKWNFWTAEWLDKIHQIPHIKFETIKQLFFNFASVFNAMRGKSDFRRFMCYGNEEWCKIWKGTDLSVQNGHDEINKFWLKHSKISKICSLMGWFWPKYTMFKPKKYRAVMLDGTQDWYNVWRKTDLCFQKWHEEFGKFSPEYLKVSKLGPSWHFFV